MRMRTTGNHETPNTSKSVHNKTAKLVAHPKTFPTVQTHVKVANMRDLRQDSKDQKIPRPPNAFMLFANDFRRKLAGEFPKESNKDISIRLGCMWKSMEKDIKDKYFQLAKEVDAAHKKKYPDYVYNPKEARLRKAIREKSRAGGQRVQGGAASSGQRGGAPASWSKPRQNMNSRQPICMQMVGDQQQLQHRQLQHQQYIQLQQQHQQPQQQQSLLRCNNRQQPPQQQSSGGGSGNTAANMMLQNYNDYLDLSYHHVAQAADYTLLPEHHQSESSWYSSTFLQQQGPNQTASSSSAYPVRSESRKVAESHEWSSHFATETNSAFIHTSAENSADKEASRSEELVDSAGRGEAVTVNGGPHHPHPHPQPQCMTAAAAAAAAGDQDNGPVPGSDIEMENGVLLEPNLLEQKSLLNLSQPSQGKLQSASDGNSSGGSKDGLRLPGFHQAFGSTEIGRFSQHEEFFEAQPLPPPQDPKSMKLDLCTPPFALFFDNESQNCANFFESKSDSDSWSFLFNSPTMLENADFDNDLPFIDYSLLANDLTSRNDEPNSEEILPDVVKSAMNDVKIEQEETRNTSSESNDESLDNNLISNNLPLNIFDMKSTEEFARHDFKINHLEQPPVIVSENDRICVLMESANDPSKEFSYL